MKIHKTKIGGTYRFHIVNPTDKQIEEIVQKYDLHDMIEEDLKENSIQDKIDIYDEKILFLALHFPKFDQKSGKHYPNEFKFIIGPDFIISISQHETTTLERIKEEYLEEIKEEDDVEQKEIKEQPFFILFRILDGLYDKTISALKKFNGDIIILENQIFDESYMINKNIIPDLLIKSRNIALIKNLIFPHNEILEELRKSLILLLGQESDIYFEDLTYKVEKLENTINTLSTHLQSLSEKYNTLMTIKSNNIMSILTITTVILGILTLITGFYGMNVRLPGQEIDVMWLSIVIFMILLSLSLFILFKKKKWI